MLLEVAADCRAKRNAGASVWRRARGAGLAAAHIASSSLRIRGLRLVVDRKYAAEGRLIVAVLVLNVGASTSDAANRHANRQQGAHAHMHRYRCRYRHRTGDQRSCLAGGDTDRSA